MTWVLTCSSILLLGPLELPGGDLPPLVIVGVVGFLGVALLAAAGANAPHRIVRWHSRLSRFHAELLAGPNWEESMRALRSDGYVDYLRDGAEHPERFAAYMNRFRRSFTVAAVIALVLFAASFVLVLLTL